LTIEALGVGAVVLVPLCAVIVAATAVVGRIELGPPALLAVLFWQVQETLRRALLAHLRHRSAAIGDAFSYLGQAALLWAIGQLTSLSPALAFLTMALTSALTMIVQAWQLRLRPHAPLFPKAALGNAWRTGRWILLSNLVNGFGFQALPWALAVARGPAETASFQAALNIVSVTNPVLPATARAASEVGLASAYRTGLRSIAQGGIMLIPFFALVAIVPEWILGLVYGPASPYRFVGGPLQLFAVAYILYYVGGLLMTLLTSLKETRRVFIAQLTSALGGILIGIPLTLWLGLAGACLGVFSIHCIRAGVGGLLLVRLYSSALTVERA
jgi:O-antigen/teichoic acid export membrane protein